MALRVALLLGLVGGMAAEVVSEAAEPGRNIFAFHAGTYLGGKGYGPWESYPWDRIQTVAVFGDHDPALVAKAASEGAKYAIATDPDDVLDPKKTGKALPNATARAAWVKSAVASAQAANATGINIDHEATASAAALFPFAQQPEQKLLHRWWRVARSRRPSPPSWPSSARRCARPSPGRSYPSTPLLAPATSTGTRNGGRWGAR